MLIFFIFFNNFDVFFSFLIGFVRRYILRKEEWRILIGNLCFIAQEYLQNEKNDSKIKEYYEFLFSLARCYAIFYEKDQQFQRFEKKGQVETILQRMKRNYGLSDPNNYLFQLNYESLLFQEEELEQIQTLSINQTDNLIRDFAQLLNTGFSIINKILLFRN